jgi:hypothetical protein
LDNIDDYDKIIAEARARVEAKKNDLELKKKCQLAQDEVRFAELCDEHGYGALSKVRLGQYFDGLPTFIVVKAPSPDLVRIHRNRILKGSRKLEGVDKSVAFSAAAELGRSCVVYPEPEVMREVEEVSGGSAYAGAGTVALQMVQTYQEEEGKD